MSGSLPDGSALPPPADSAPPPVETGWRWSRVRHNDTLQAIARREMGDAARWPELAEINGLVPPWLTADPAVVAVAQPGRVLLFGQAIKVASATDPRDADADDDPEAALGRDIRLDASGQIAASGGDFATVMGLANLAGALSRRLATRRGELVYHDAYGSGVPDMVGRSNSPGHAALAARAARLAAESDPRVARVREASATARGDRLELHLSVEPVTGGAPLALREEL